MQANSHSASLNLTEEALYSTETATEKRILQHNFLSHLNRGSIIVWRFKAIFSADLQFHSHLSGGLWLRSYPAVAGNHKFSLQFSVLACFGGGYSNS